jgi:hypothetical protein
MSTAKKLALIAAGFALAVAGGFLAVVVNETLMPADTAQGSPGMVAFGDMVLFVFVAGFLGIVPTFFLLKLSVEKAPRALLAAILLIAVLGPVSWLTMVTLAEPPAQNTAIPDPTQIMAQIQGLLIAFGAVPRIVLGPVLLVIEGVTFLLVRGRITRILLAAAMLMDLVPLGIFALHIMRARPY